MATNAVVACVVPCLILGFRPSVMLHHNTATSILGCAMAPSEGKKHPRRILSFDALTNRTPFNVSDQHQVRGPPQKPPTLQHIIEKESMLEASEASPDHWTGIELVESPRAAEDDARSFRTESPGPEQRGKPRKPAPLKFTRPTTPDSVSLASPSRARWEHLRQHVLPIPIRPATPPQPPPPPPGAVQTLPPPRAPTPKPSRLARLGFRQVVEHAREVAFDDTRRFSLELERICWNIRFAEPQKVKVDREPMTIGSSLYLPFASSTSLAATGNSSVDNVFQGSHKQHEMRKSQSVQSIAMAYRTASSVRPLYQTLLHHATPIPGGALPVSTLPLEYLVLSTLLAPFLVSDRSSIDEERWLAIEAFDVITRTWPPRDEVSLSGYTLYRIHKFRAQVLGVERYLWCCKAAFIPPSSMRTRLLSILWTLMIPTENNYSVTIPECFKALSQGLFTLLPSLQPLSTSISAQEEIMLCKDMISKIRTGSCGELDTTPIREDYNVVLSAKDDSSMIRRAIMLGALSQCLEDCTDDSRLWLLHNALEVTENENGTLLHLSNAYKLGKLDNTSKGCSIHTALGRNSFLNSQRPRTSAA